ncbi:amidohydrolase, imidazolonepropionase [Desulfosporosinus acidiphilus SJ4]|uniref:Amidohydrolase, imidazolonepropionase n=1 Tax=Desulfosporosinus acidiphilus (strain DSM 22704 / JCM 16185 / SJ4) TaxID=646529 RepID=I4D7M4_DESAJ|nr:amidohydrolase [Desulfosporosinus acidiphilus]AFM41798.1 amidohydrolase, imidazolonepropionase [Desulfosporosinus acidiphilus SJ4]
MYSLLLKNCLILEQHGNVELKDILIEKGKITSLGENLSSAGRSKTIDIEEHYVLPGFIDCHTHLGIIEECTGKIGVDNNETSNAVTPHLRGIDAVNPLDVGFKDALKSGVTTVMVGPGSNNVVGGLSLACKTSGSIIDQMIIKSPVGLKIALGENPINTYGTDSKCPVTRMGTAALIRELFARAEDYQDLKKQGKIKYRDLRLESIIPVLQGEIPLRAHAHRADDIVTAVRIAEEFKIHKLVIEHGTEADLVKDYLKEREIPVAFGPMLTPRIKMELKSRNYKTAVNLVAAGIKVALITDHPYNSIDQLRTIAALSISEGLNQDDALRALTINPAEILGCGQQIGAIKNGFDADLVVFDGNPFNLNSKVDFTFINGQPVYSKDMTQSKLQQMPPEHK